MRTQRFLVAAILLCCCGLLARPAGAEESCGSLGVAAWLIGEWTASDGDKVITESWRRVSDTTFEGRGVTTKAASGEPVDGEWLRLVQMGSGVFYVAKVAHNPLPVGFALTQCPGQRLVFENSAHDFPKKLEYEAHGNDRMTARVSDGKDKGFTINYQRKP
ncbi:MAG TPA: DUF6265 family protein [Povalibacter sp.]|nr:DUF6265 family protein [Povalibacter sp.]